MPLKYRDDSGKITLPIITLNGRPYNLNDKKNVRFLAATLAGNCPLGRRDKIKGIMGYIKSYLEKTHKSFAMQDKILPAILLLEATIEHDTSRVLGLVNEMQALEYACDDTKFHQALMQGKRSMTTTGIYSHYCKAVRSVGGYTKEQAKTFRKAFAARVYSPAWLRGMNRKFKKFNTFFNRFTMKNLGGGHALLSRLPRKDSGDIKALKEQLPCVVLSYVEPWELTGVESIGGTEILQPADWQHFASDKPLLDHSIIEAAEAVQGTDVRVDGLQPTTSSSDTSTDESKDTEHHSARLLQVFLPVTDYAVVGDDESKDGTINPYIQRQVAILNLCVATMEQGGVVLSHCKSGCGRSLEIILALEVVNDIGGTDALLACDGEQLMKAINTAYADIKEKRDISTDAGRLLSVKNILQAYQATITPTATADHRDSASSSPALRAAV